MLPHEPERVHSCAADQLVTVAGFGNSRGVRLVGHLCMLGTVTENPIGLSFSHRLLTGNNIPMPLASVPHLPHEIA